MDEKKSFWATLPGVLTGIAMIITAIGGLIGGLYAAGIIGGQSPSPTIAYSPSSLSFTATQGGSNPSSQTLGIRNSGSGTLNWSLSDNGTWLTLTPIGGTSTGEADDVMVSVNISGMSAGNHSATITISAAGATNTPQTVPVNLTMNPPIPSPTIAYSPSSLNFTANTRFPNPPSKILRIRNSGSGALEWSVSDSGTWLELTPMSGIAIEEEEDEVKVLVDISGMSVGDYNATITISAKGATNTPQTVPVNLNIFPGEIIP